MERKTPEWIAEQRAVCDAATQGAWYPDGFAVWDDNLGEYIEIESKDAAFIASARSALPSALDALEASMQREAEKDAEIERLKFTLHAKARAEIKQTTGLSEAQKMLVNYIRECRASGRDAIIDKTETHLVLNAMESVIRLTAAPAAEKRRADAAVNDLNLLCYCDVCTHMVGGHCDGDHSVRADGRCTGFNWIGPRDVTTDALTGAESRETNV